MENWPRLIPGLCGNFKAFSPLWRTGGSLGVPFLREKNAVRARGAGNDQIENVAAHRLQRSQSTPESAMHGCSTSLPAWPRCNSRDGSRAAIPLYFWNAGPEPTLDLALAKNLQAVPVR